MPRAGRKRPLATQRQAARFFHPFRRESSDHADAVLSLICARSRPVRVNTPDQSLFLLCCGKSQSERKHDSLLSGRRPSISATIARKPALVKSFFAYRRSRFFTPLRTDIRPGCGYTPGYARRRLVQRSRIRCQRFLPQPGSYAPVSQERSSPSNSEGPQSGAL